MDIGSLLLGLALVVVVVFIAVLPLLEFSGRREQPATPAEQLINSRERVLVQLRDLDFDDATGKINAEDYAVLRAKLVAEGVAILKQLDALGVTADEGETSAALPEDAIEAAVAQKRANRAPAAMGAAAVSAAPADEIEAAVAQARARRTSPKPTGPGLKPANGGSQAADAPARSKATGNDLDAEIEAKIAQRRAPAPGAAPVDAHVLSCAQCGTEVLPDDRFCPKCGSPQMVACGNCGRVARAGDQFCAQCGQALPASVAGAAKA